MRYVGHMYFKKYMLNKDVLNLLAPTLINLKTCKLSHENVTILYKSNRNKLENSILNN